MDPQKQREIASKGGKAAHLAGTAHEFTPEEAREAGRKGGQASGGSRARAAARNLALQQQQNGQGMVIPSINPAERAVETGEDQRQAS